MYKDIKPLISSVLHQERRDWLTDRRLRDSGGCSATEKTHGNNISIDFTVFWKVKPPNELLFLSLAPLLEVRESHSGCLAVIMCAKGQMEIAP